MIYTSDFRNAINQLKEKGFQEDFMLFDNELFWVQPKIFIADNDFTVCDCWILAHPSGRDKDMVLFCIETVFTPSKGILINHYSFTPRTPSLIIRKLHGVKLKTT